MGADVLRGTLRYPSDTGGWQLGNLDLSEYLDRYRNQRLVLIIAPLGDTEPTTSTCSVCGFVVNQVGECPRCKLTSDEHVSEATEAGETRDILDQVTDLLTSEEA